MTIQELARRANVTTRTIRYYVEQGLLSPPGRGRVAEYTDEHLRRLELIRTLKGQYLPLEEIRRVVSGLDSEQLEELVARTAVQPEADTPSTSAADYITSLLARSAQREQAILPASLPPRAESPVHYQPVPPPPLVAASAPVTAHAPAPDAALAQRRLEVAEQAVEASTWRRVPLAPGIELHYLQSEKEGHKTLVERLVAAFLAATSVILESSPEKEK